MKFDDPVAITRLFSVSALGTSETAPLYPKEASGISYSSFLGVAVGQIPGAAERELQQFIEANSAYAGLDRSVQLALFTSDKVIKEGVPQGRLGVTFGSSRGATSLLEHSIERFVTKAGGLEPATSPSTTLGNISSWVSQHAGSNGVSLSHSSTCSTAFHSIGNAVAWMRAGMADCFIAGASEACLTPFTIAQMQALRIYSNLTEAPACRPLELLAKSNSFVLGEGACAVLLESGKCPASRLANISGIGFAIEGIRHPVDISSEGKGLQSAMLQACGSLVPDCIILHSPGTRRGDAAELHAINEVFGDRIPYLIAPKWRTGHTFSAAGALSMEMAIRLFSMEAGLLPAAIGVPYATILNEQNVPQNIRTVLINTAGFGGNCASLLLTEP